MKQIGIFGYSGFARETADIAIALNIQPIFIVRESNEIGNEKPNFDWITENQLNDLAELPLAIGIGDNAIRQNIFKRFITREFPNLIHPSSTFGYGQREQLEQNKGLIICAGVRLTNNIEMGDFCIINLNATIGHDCLIEKFVNIAPGANISGNVHIKEGCWIGTNAAINQGSDSTKLELGERCVIGSGAVVIKPCNPDGVYVGAPAVRKK